MLALYCCTSHRHNGRHRNSFRCHHVYNRCRRRAISEISEDEAGETRRAKIQRESWKGTEGACSCTGKSGMFVKPESTHPPNRLTTRRMPLRPRLTLLNLKTKTPLPVKGSRSSERNYNIYDENSPALNLLAVAYKRKLQVWMLV